MKAQLAKIGNSKGIRLPRAIIEQCGFGNVVELTVKGKSVVISPIHSPRSGWAEAFANAAEKEDVLIDVTNDWDDKAWTW